MVRLNFYSILLLMCLGLFVCGSSHAAITSGPFVTDVNMVQFSVVWTTSEPSSGSVDVFIDSNATTSATEAVVTGESVEHPPAEDIGVIKITVTGLKADTQYFYQAKSITKSTNQVEVSPLGAVRTEEKVAIVDNGLIAQKVSIGSNKPAPGTLVMASVDQASYPVTGWVGSGVPDQWVLINTMNFYSSEKFTRPDGTEQDAHVNLKLDGGEVINLTLLGGILGTVVTQDRVPQNDDGVQPLNIAAVLPDSASTSPSSSEHTDSGGGGGGGAACFIATASGDVFGF